MDRQVYLQAHVHRREEETRFDRLTRKKIDGTLPGDEKTDQGKGNDPYDVSRSNDRSHRWTSDDDNYCGGRDLPHAADNQTNPGTAVEAEGGLSAPAGAVAAQEATAPTPGAEAPDVGTAAPAELSTAPWEEDPVRLKKNLARS